MNIDQPLLAHVFDTETAGLHGGVCDLAIAVIDENFDVVYQVESMIDPERPIDPSASGVHHITDDMVVNEPTLGEFMELHGNPFTKFGPKPTLVGHNVQFDIRMCAAVLPEVHSKICTLKLARAAWPTGVSDHKLQTLRYAFRLDAGTAHRAMGDVVTCISLLRLMNREKGWTLAQMIELSRAPMSPDTKFPFGKHKGVKLKDLPRQYVQWALSPNGLSDIEPDLKAALERLL